LIPFTLAAFQGVFPDYFLDKHQLFVKLDIQQHYINLFKKNYDEDFFQLKKPSKSSVASILAL